jgi:hypothetical protein
VSKMSQPSNEWNSDPAPMEPRASTVSDSPIPTDGTRQPSPMAPTSVDSAESIVVPQSEYKGQGLDYTSPDGGGDGASGNPDDGAGGSGPGTKFESSGSCPMPTTCKDGYLGDPGKYAFEIIALRRVPGLGSSPGRVLTAEERLIQSELGVEKATVQANRAAGNAFRDEVAQTLRDAGRQVETEVYKRTPFGKRFIDIEVSDGGKVLGGVETKLGGSRYLPSQRAKDAWLQWFENYPVNVVRGP